MLSPADALERVLALTRRLGPLSPERVPLHEAAGRVLAAAVRAPVPLPAFAGATMDGYALAARDARRPGACLPVAFEVAAGRSAPPPLPRGACCRIFTGAPLPPGADCVEMQERVERRGDLACLARAAEAGRFVKRAGSDVKRGAVALAAGLRLDPGAIGLAAALGVSRLPVHRRPRVVILPTGDELRPIGARLQAGEVHDSNAHALRAAVEDAGGVAIVLPIVRDDRAALRRAIRRARGADVLVTSGGVSVGDRDLVRQTLIEAGARLDFWRVAMRPGKPVAVGRLGHTLVFGLPGNPASALVSFELFARPALRALAGLRGTGRILARGRLAEPQEKPPELTVYLRTRAAVREGTLWLTPLATQLSGHVSSAAGVGALAILPHSRRRLGRGAQVEAILLDAPDGR